MLNRKFIAEQGATVAEEFLEGGHKLSNVENHCIKVTLNNLMKQYVTEVKQKKLKNLFKLKTD